MSEMLHGNFVIFNNLKCILSLMFFTLLLSKELCVLIFEFFNFVILIEFFNSINNLTYF